MSSRPSELIRQVTATFGRLPIQPDADWEQELAEALRDTNDKTELMGLFGRFRSGLTAFDASMRRVVMKALCKRVGHGLQVEPDVVLKHPETFEFGDSVFIGAQTMVQGRFDGSCRIGNHTWIGPHSYFDARLLELGDFVGWGPGAKVLGSAHTGIPVEDPVIATDLRIELVVVESGADIGMNASILPGVRIGANAIVGAGAVVTRDIPEYAIAAGVPARVIRDRREQ